MNEACRRQGAAAHDTEVSCEEADESGRDDGDGTRRLAALAPASPAATVCNEAENSHRGGYEVQGGTVDPVPPAFLRGSQMRVGKDGSRELDNAADRPPALRQCAPEGGGGNGGLPT
jgi:hypothetical protein